MSHPNFPTLPRELRLHILSYTHLLRRYDWCWRHSASGSGATICSGKLLVPPTSSPPRPTARTRPPLSVGTARPARRVISSPSPRHYSWLSKTMNEDASEVFWGMQRFVIKGDLGAGRRWVEGLRGRNVGRIRALDVEVDSQLVCGMGMGIGRVGDWGLVYAEQWRALIDAIVRRCCLEKLWLCIDAGSELVAETLQEVYTDDGGGMYEYHDSTVLKRAYRGLVKPVKEAVNRRRPARFHVFLCWGVEGEGTAEREIMGQGYDSEREGKVSYYKRDVRSPHWTVLEEEEGRNQKRFTGLENIKMDGGLDGGDN